MRRSGAPSIRRGQGGVVKSNEEILALLSSSKPANVFTPPSSANNTIHTAQKSPFASPKLPSFSTAKLGPTLPANNKPLNEDPSRVGDAAGEKGKYSYFTCVWGKKSGRKHKKWEGDGIVKVGERSVLVLDEDGKELARGGSYKVTELQDVQEGQLIPVGGKEIEITGLLDEDDWLSKVNLGKENCKAVTTNVDEKPKSVISKGKKRKADEDLEPEASSTKSQPPPPSVSPKSDIVAAFLKRVNNKKFQIPRLADGSQHDTNGGGSGASAPRSVTPGIPMYDANREGALVLPRPPPGHPLYTDKMVDVVVDPCLGLKLRPHQRNGVIFLYRSLLGFTSVNVQDEDFKVNGCILADDMGLGKTLQTISVLWTLLKQSPVAGSSLARKVLIVAPASLLNNWEAEFKKWLGTARIIIHVADNIKKVSGFKCYRSAPVLVISYEMLVRAETELRDIKWDVVVCDEAHRLKNSEIKTSSALARLNCEKKILLTGTPVQNDLHEYYCLMSVVTPGLLGTKATFTTDYVQRIEKGRQLGALQEEIEEAELALTKLSEISRKVVLRRTSDIISSLLPPKTTCVVFCRPSEFQAAVYSREVERLYSQVSSEPGTHLTAIGTLKKICNSPYLVEGLQAGDGPNTWEEQSGKLSTLTCLLLTIMQTTDEKVVLVSLSTSTLDLLETLCSRYDLATLRLDGKTPPAARQTLVNRFNKPDFPERVFLLSSKAGGTGLNLIGASRIVLYDIDWNPATDLQVMARIWRSGQKRPCHIYRLLTTGTIEEKIYQRQVMKSGLAGGLETASMADLGASTHFTPEELKDIFTFRTDTECETHDLLECECGGSGCVLGQDSDGTGQPARRACQLGTSKPAERCKSNMEKLMEWRHYTCPIYDKISDECLGAAESFISFLFSHYQDSQVNNKT